MTREDSLNVLRTYISDGGCGCSKPFDCEHNVTATLAFRCLEKYLENYLSALINEEDAKDDQRYRADRAEDLHRKLAQAARRFVDTTDDHPIPLAHTQAFPWDELTTTLEQHEIEIMEREAV